MQNKSILQSKTFWFNVVTVFIAAADALAGTGAISVEALAIINSIGNIALRMVTTQGVTIAGKPVVKSVDSLVEEVSK